MKHILPFKVDPWQYILSSRGPRVVQEVQGELPQFRDFLLCFFKKSLSLKLNYSMKIKDT